MCISKRYIEDLDKILKSINEEEATVETEKTTQFKLRACPFCGEPKDFRVQYGRVTCNFCSAQGPTMPNDELAIAFWNKQVNWVIEQND